MAKKAKKGTFLDKIYPMKAEKQMKWYKGFVISHTIGYIVAWLQTLWIVWEVRRKK